MRGLECTAQLDRALRSSSASRLLEEQERLIV